MAEEVVPHEGVIALGVFLGEVDILVHVECHNVLERYLSLLVKLDESSVHAEGRTAGGAAEHERMFGCGIGGVDTGSHIICGPLRHVVVVFFDDKSHV